ncbi:MAG: glycosyltransferase [Erythrobacter sp.]|uniref:glycosyltransferase n=1 Tax=Erythrobacter sp. TaxID=1042 RepID=UPI003A8B9474
MSASSPPAAQTRNAGLAVFARLGSRPIPRVVRMMEEARGLGFDTLFLSGRREEGLADEEVYSGHNVRRIGPFFPLLNGRAGWLYLRSVLGYNHALWRQLRQLRPAIVHCSDIETMPAGILYRRFSGARLIYNVHDNLAQRYTIPAWAQAVLAQVEGLAVRLSSIALVPEEFRRDMLPSWCRRKIAVVRNTPTDRGALPPNRQRKPIKLFFGGWLDKGRGLGQLLKLVRENEEFELTLAGEGSAELVAEIEANPRTRYLGFVTHDEIMRETAKAHIVTALYDPVRPINRYAASNKLSEALSCGRPALVNSEMVITGSLAEYDCLIAVPYSEINTAAVEQMRAAMADDGARYDAMCVRAREAFEARYAWKVAQNAMIAAIRG